MSHHPFLENISGYLQKKAQINKRDAIKFRYMLVSRTVPFDFERTARVYSKSGRLQHPPMQGCSLRPSLVVELQAERNYAGFQAACNHLTHSQMGSQPVSKAVRARGSGANRGRQSEGLLIEPPP